MVLKLQTVHLADSIQAEESVTGVLILGSISSEYVMLAIFSAFCLWSYLYVVHIYMLCGLQNCYYSLGLLKMKLIHVEFLKYVSII